MSQYNAGVRRKQREEDAKRTNRAPSESGGQNNQLRQLLVDRVMDLEQVYGADDGLGLYERVDALERRMRNCTDGRATEKPDAQTQVAFEASAAQATGDSAGARALSLNDTAGLFAAADKASRLLRGPQPSQMEQGGTHGPVSLRDRSNNIPKISHVRDALGWDENTARLLVEELRDAALWPNQCQACLYCTRTPFDHSGICNQFRLLTNAERTTIEVGARQGKGNTIVSTLQDRMAKIAAVQAEESAKGALDLLAGSRGGVADERTKATARRNRIIGPATSTRADKVGAIVADNRLRGWGDKAADLDVAIVSPDEKDGDEYALLIPPDHLNGMDNDTLLANVEAVREYTRISCNVYKCVFCVRLLPLTSW